MSNFNSFTYQKGKLNAEDVALSTIANAYNTPCYVYSRAAIEHAFLAYVDALKDVPSLICYAVKANSNLAVLNVLARLGAGFDVVSAGELQRVIAAGGDPAKVVFSGVGKKPQEMRTALEAGIFCFNIESNSEIHTLQREALALDIVANVSLRVNPDVDAKTHPYISTGLSENKFGIAIDEAVSAYQLVAAQSHLKIVGVDCHIGSQLIDTSPYLDALKRLLRLIDDCAEHGIIIEHIDLGGGLGVTYNDELPPSPQAYLAELLAELKERKLMVLVEPGRSIVANAGVLLTEVLHLKNNGERHFAIIDAAMNDMIRPALYDAWLDVEPLTQPNHKTSTQAYDLVGPVCETGDFIAKQRVLALAEGDLLAIKSSGAYGFVMSSNYNTRGRAAEVMVDGEQTHLIRERESFEHMIKGEAILPQG